MIRLSFIIPVYNVSKYLGRCIASVRNQGLAPNEYEIIVVNDGSTDDSMEVLHNFMERETHSGTEVSPIIIVNQENKGLSAARNAGFDKARGSYVWFVDSDDTLEACFAPRLLERVRKGRLDILCFGLNLVYEENGLVERYAIPDTTKGRTVSGEEFLLNCHMPAAACL